MSTVLFGTNVSTSAGPNTEPWSKLAKPRNGVSSSCPQPPSCGTNTTNEL
jgi:hypothetical protein